VFSKAYFFACPYDNPQLCKDRLGSLAQSMKTLNDQVPCFSVVVEGVYANTELLLMEVLAGEFHKERRGYMNWSTMKFMDLL
jgi:hypothetical protein